MILFLVGWRPSGGVDAKRAEEALRAFLARLPFFDSERIDHWEAPSRRAALAQVAHHHDRVGGVRYVEVDAGGMALYSGRPFQWTADGCADGRRPLEPGFYRRPASLWAGELDGRCAAVRYDDQEGELDVYSDPIGAYPVFSGELDGTSWISNSAELVRTALETSDLNLSAAACVLGGGHSVNGEPIWAGVRRLPRGVLHLRAHRPAAQAEVLSLEAIASLAGSGFDPRRAAHDLVAATGALGDWPGRPTLLQLSGGRDSRLILAAASAAGIEVEAVTAGSTESPDVRTARLLCEQVGVRHRLLPPDPGGALQHRTREVARIVGLAAAGTLSIEDAAGYPIDRSSGALPLWLGGQGGEIARAYYGNGSGKRRDTLVRHLVGAFADSAELLSASGKECVEREVGRAVDDQLAAGVAPEDVPDLFYLLNRMATWSASGFGCVEYAKGDSITPLWCRRLLAHQLGPPSRERAQQRFHQVTLEALSPQLSRVPYAGYSTLFRPGSRDFVPVLDLVRDAVEARPSDPVWEVLERRAVEKLLARDPGSIEKREQRHVWRLASVFMSEGAGRQS